MLTVQLLGPVAVDVDGTPLDVGQPRQRGLLAWLALVHPRPSTVESIVAALWGVAAPASAHNAIQVYVSGLRKALRSHGVDVERVGDAYALRGQDLVVDTTAFDDAVSQGRTALRTGQVAEAAALLERAEAQWIGSPLAGLGDLSFISAARETLIRTHAESVLDLARAYLRLDRPADAVAASGRLVAAHPYDEAGWVVLATGHYRAGRQEAALAACRDARAVLLDELGVDPGPELTQLELDILRHELPSPAGTADEAADDADSAQTAQGDVCAPLPPEPPLLLGRDDLLSSVTGWAARRGQLVTLAGIGGIGKTTLAVSAAHALARDGLRTAFASLADVITAEAATENVCRALGLDPGGEAEGVLRQRLDGSVDLLVLDNVEQIQDFGTSLRTWWTPSADAPSILVTSRLPLHLPEEHVVTVPPLSMTTASTDASPAVQLFLARAEHHEAPAVEVARLCEILDGIPLAIEMAAAHTRVMTIAQLTARLEAARPMPLAFPSRADDHHASIAMILDTTWTLLPGSSKALLRLLGEVDGLATIELLEPATGLSSSEFVAALDDLVAGGLVVRGDGGLRLLVPVREYCRGLPGREEFIERLVNRAVELAYGGPADIAGPDSRAEVARLGAAGDALTSAISRGVETGMGREAAALVFRLYRMWLLTGRLVEARRWIGLVQGADGLDPVDATKLGLLGGTFASYVNDPGSADVLIKALDEAADLDVPNDRILVNAWCCLAAFLAHHEKPADALEAAAQAAAVAAASESPALVDLARDLRAYVASYTGEVELALQLSLEGLEDARRAGDDYDIVSMLTQTANNLATLHRLAAAKVLADEAFDRVSNLEAASILGHLLLTRGLINTAAGNLIVARSDLTAALRLTVEAYPDPLATADCIYVLAHGASLSGEDEQAARLFGASEAIYEEHGVKPGDRVAALGDAERNAARDRLGPELFDILASSSRGDPAALVSRLTAGSAPVGS